MAEMKEVAVAFACESDRSELSPTHILSEELCHQAGVRYEDVFTDAAAMARMAQTVKAADKDVLCRLPFSVAVEAEQYGAVLSLNRKTRLPAVRGFPTQSWKRSETCRLSILPGGRWRRRWLRRNCCLAKARRYFSICRAFSAF